MFFEEIDVESASQILTELQPFNDRWNEEISPKKPLKGYYGWYFRGVSDSEYGLLPSAFRPNNPWSFPYPTVKEQIRQEALILHHFFEECDSNGLHIPHDSVRLRSYEIDAFMKEHLIETLKQKPWPFEEWLTLASFAQHYQLPTRLLDWSRSSKIALYFAASSIFEELIKTRPSIESVNSSLCTGKKFSVWALSYLVTKIKNETKGIYITGAPTSLIPNLRAQKGVFSLAFDRKQQEEAITNSDLPFQCQDLQSFIFDLVRDPNSEANPDYSSYHGKRLLYKFNVDYRHIPEILHCLDYEGINAGTIYPGHAHTAKTVVFEKYLSRLVSLTRGSRKPEKFTVQSDDS